MKKLLITLFIITTGYVIYCQNSSYPDLPYTNLWQIDTKGDNIFAAGSCNIAMVSNDKGDTWEYLNLPSGYVKGVNIIPGTQGQKAMYNFKNKLIVIDNSNFSVKDVADNNIKNIAGTFYYVLFDNANMYLIAENGIFQTKLEEFKWEEKLKFNFSDEYVNRSSISENYIWLGTSSGKLIKININDFSYSEVFNFQNRIYSIEMADDSIGYITYQTGTKIVKTTDGGNTFYPLPGMPESINPTALGRDILFTINTNRLYVSTDGGKISEYIKMPSDGMTGLVNGHKLLHDTTLYLVGESGMIMKTKDLAQSFEHLNPILRDNLISISFDNSGHGYAIGGKKTTLYTFDGGKNWNITEWDTIMNTSKYTILPIDNNKFLLGHSGGISILKDNQILTTTEGAGQLLYKSVINDDIFAIRYIDGYKLSKSTDGGLTWENIFNINYSPPNLQQIANGNLYTVDKNGMLIRSIDGGYTWDNIQLEGITDKVNDFFIYSANLALFYTGYNTLYLTTDGGKTTHQVASGYGISNLHIFNDKHFLFTLAFNDQTTIKETTNGGLNWQTTGKFCSSTFSSYFDGNKTLWLGQKGGHINKHSILETSGLEYNESNSENLVLYPNPIKSGIHVNLINSNPEKYSCLIISMTTGKLIKSIPFLNSTKINTYGINPGAYLIKLQDKSGKIQVGKLLIE